MLDQVLAHKVIIGLTLVALLLIVVILFRRSSQATVPVVQSEGYSLFTEIPAICGKQAIEACKDLKDAVDSSTPSSFEYAFNKYDTCVHDQVKKCSCEPANKDKIVKACLNDLKNSQMFEDRVYGCYQAGTKEEVQKCFKDPYNYLCVDTKHPQQEQCEDIEVMCKMDFC